MNFRQILAALTLALATATGALAATIAERSPFTQGLWWNPQRAGHGFELFNAGTEVMALWYTYDRNNTPVWYSAQGKLGETWPLRKHHWSGSQISGTDIVGSLALKVDTPETAEVSYTVDGASGKHALEPFRLSGVGRDVDRSGAYFDPTASGWGLSLLHQGEVLGGVLYTYNASGVPTWYAGFDRTEGNTIAVHRTRGSCATCPYQPTTSDPAGHLTFTARSETEMTLGNKINAAFAPAASPDGARMVQLSRSASSRAADRGLANFPSDTSLKSFLDAAMQVLQPNPGADFSPAPPASSTFSTTNLIEAGVDEADLVKTDGTRIYTFDSVNGMRQPAIRIARVSDEGAQVAVEGTVPIAITNHTNLINAGLYLDAGRLVSITGPGISMTCATACWSIPSLWTGGATHIEIFDTSGTGLPVSTWRAKVDGHLVSSRRIGNRLYVVARHAPTLPGFVLGASSGAALAANRDLLSRTLLSQLLPSVSVNGGTPEPLVGPSTVFVPPQGTRPVAADMVLVYAIDLGTRSVAQALAILGTSDAVYASPDNLYVATSRYAYRTPRGVLLPAPPFSTTEVHQVRLAGNDLALVGTGTVEGSLAGDPEKSAFRMSERGGRLRIVTSDTMMWGSGTKNRLTILEPTTSGGLLKTVSWLPNAARPESIGKPGELLYGTRFVDDRLYAVTFRNIDPLYVIDLANPADPKITGSLELPGFSEYLHPLPNGLLLGFGKDAIPTTGTGDGAFAWFQGLQVSLFDVSGTGAPRELQRVLIGKRGSDSALLKEHKALATRIRADGSLEIAFPARIHGGNTPSYGIGDQATYPWVESSLLRFEVQAADAASARITELPRLVIEKPPREAGAPSLDSTAYTGRAILFPKGPVYMGHGRFYHADPSGSTRGPY